MLICSLVNACALSYGGLTDYKKREIPNLVPIILLITGLCRGMQAIPNFIFMLITVFALLLTEKIQKSRLPGGDFKLICALVFSAGPICLLAILFLVRLGAALVSIVRKQTQKRNIPLCTYVAPAYILLCVTQLI